MSIRTCPSCGTDVDVSNGHLGCPVCGGSLAAGAPAHEAPTSILQFFADTTSAGPTDTAELPRVAVGRMAPDAAGGATDGAPGTAAPLPPEGARSAPTGPGQDGLVRALSGQPADQRASRRLPSGLLLVGAVAVGGLAVLAAFALKGSSGAATAQDVAPRRAGATSSAPAAPPASPPSAAPSSTPTTAAADPATAARTVEGLLERSDQARGVLNAATGPLGACRIDPAGAAATIQSVVDDRKRILGDLQGLSAQQVDALPSGSQLVASLASALQASVAADEAYVQWAKDAAGCTPGQAPPGQALRQGNELSRSAQSAKAAFVSLWNPIARIYGLGTRTANQV